eukprot:TRINITY_DN779_c0_g1_i1.p1 TRINITY_DN779_c0_g1~~TRINITY_DN779_c0_g1_i1.p1  ORF type:complete len:296 (+),score=91.31 TRINITY_DN779_c0_g1_i1:38-925(+)
MNSISEDFLLFVLDCIFFFQIVLISFFRTNSSSMKYLDLSVLSDVNSMLAALASTDHSVAVTARVEAYSCKRTAGEKKKFKALMGKDNDKTGKDSDTDKDSDKDKETSKEDEKKKENNQTTKTDLKEKEKEQDKDKDKDKVSVTVSPRKRASVAEKEEREVKDTIFNLTATLNASFPDYDFDSAKSDNFRQDYDTKTAQAAINATLTSVDPTFSDNKQKVWSMIDKEIGLENCVIYSYIPDPESDPFVEEGCLWSLNYFFYNKELKRILFFTCKCQKNEIGSDDDEESEVPADNN